MTKFTYCNIKEFENVNLKFNPHCLLIHSGAVPIMPAG